MTTSLDKIIAELDEASRADFEQRLRDRLKEADPQWLTDEVVRWILQEHELHESSGRKLSRAETHVEPPAERKKRLSRIRSMKLDAAALRQRLAEYRCFDRATLEAQGYLQDPPHKGKGLLTSEHRSPEGERLLQQAHDLFYALLFCDESQGIQLSRAHRDFLTVIMPASKSKVLERFMLAVTEMPAQGTWLDPEGVSDDIDATNKILQVEFGDTSDELVSDGLIVVLALINNLEVNEEILYARIEQLERSSLVQ